MKEYHLYPVDTLNRIFNHIGVYEPDSGELSRYIETSETVNVGSASIKDEVGEMLDETRQLLEKFYSPYNAMLSDLLNDPKFNFF